MPNNVYLMVSGSMTGPSLGDWEGKTLFRWLYLLNDCLIYTTRCDNIAVRYCNLSATVVLGSVARNLYRFWSRDNAGRGFWDKVRQKWSDGHIDIFSNPDSNQS